MTVVLSYDVEFVANRHQILPDPSRDAIIMIACVVVDASGKKHRHIWYTQKDSPDCADDGGEFKRNHCISENHLLECFAECIVNSQPHVLTVYHNHMRALLLARCETIKQNNALPSKLMEAISLINGLNPSVAHFDTQSNLSSIVHLQYREVMPLRINRAVELLLGPQSEKKPERCFWNLATCALDVCDNAQLNHAIVTRLCAK